MNGNSPAQEHANTIKTVQSIPQVMRTMGWMTSAELMERWLRSPAWVLPPEMKEHQPGHRYTTANTDHRIVRMNWALSNSRIRVALNSLRSKMTNEAARTLLRKRLKEVKWGMDNKVRFGCQHDSASELENSCQVNRELFGGNLRDTMDDMNGALGAANLKVALIGDATRNIQTGRIALHATAAGFYIRDTYDFNGTQYLGAWTTDRVLNQAQTALNFPRRDMAYRGSPVQATHVSNATFDHYRRATGNGGDFVIYSDVLWEKIDLLLEFPG